MFTCVSMTMMTASDVNVSCVHTHRCTPSCSLFPYHHPRLPPSRPRSIQVRQNKHGHAVAIPGEIRSEKPPEYESAGEETTGEPTEFASSAEETTSDLDDLPSLARGALSARRMKEFRKFISVRQIEPHEQVRNVAHIDCKTPRRYLKG